MRRFLAVGICGLLSSAAVAPQKPPAVEHHADANNGGNQRPQNAAAITAIPTGDYYRPCDQARNEGQSDLCAQWEGAKAARKTAEWTELQFVLSIFGFAGLIITLLLTWRSTRAAVETLDAQIAAERPLLQLEKVDVKPSAASTQELLELCLGFQVRNYGRTGAWIEKVSLVVEDRHDEHKVAGDEATYNAFIGPEKPFKVWNTSNKADWLFDRNETHNVRTDKRVYVWGYSIYRDAGGRRWRTGFAGLVIVDDEMKGSGFSPQALSEHWFDERIFGARRRWYSFLSERIRRRK